MIGMDAGIYSGYLDQDVAAQMFPDLDMVTAGWIHPEGKAEKVDGGYRITGRWRFGSGLTHCDWLAAGCVVEVDGAPVPDPSGSPTQWRVALARPDEYAIHDTWFTTGLAGSGSKDYSADGLFVPEDRTFSFSEPFRTGPLHALRCSIVRCATSARCASTPSRSSPSRS